MDNTSPSKTLSKQQRIWQVISQIPEGNVLSYKGVALQAGMVPQAARLVGLVLKQLPKDTKLPWHRVVNSQGKISLPAHSAAYREQKQRLLSEGIVFNKEKILPDHFLQ